MNASKAGKGNERNRNVFNFRQPVIHIAFVKGVVYHSFSYSFGPLRESGF